ncbi:MAG: Flp pilus assembly protein CpaB, partial [Caulobacteraceae bacterium]|nr:Flp pilus assembly protein CpaB [Caulobacteraceae bacterium]
MGPARIIVLAVAAVAFIGVFLIAHGLMSHKPPPPAPVVAVAPPPAPMTQVLVAKRDLAVGTSLAEGDLDWQPMPAEKVRPDFITNGAAVTPASGAAAVASNAAAVAAAAVSSSGGPMQALY